MRAVVQRVKAASVTLQETGEVSGRIERGLMILLGVGKGDGAADAAWLAEKIAGLRIFEDEAGKMNKSVVDIGGAALVVSQFTLYGDCRKGRRPGFDQAAPPEIAEELYQEFVGVLKRQISVECGVFRTDMLVEISNDGPVTMLLDSSKTF